MSVSVRERGSALDYRDPPDAISHAKPFILFTAIHSRFRWARHSLPAIQLS